MDIALKGEKITFQTIRGISYELNEETLMPYDFDVLNYHTLNNQELTGHIDQMGICFYEKSANYDFDRLNVSQVSEENNSVYPDVSVPDKNNRSGCKQ